MLNQGQLAEGVEQKARQRQKRMLPLAFKWARGVVVWWGYRSSEGPHITRGLRWLTVINDQKSGPSHTPLNTVDPNRSAETLHLQLIQKNTGMSGKILQR
ncbi:hypothetical protein NQZ68_002959 [Dissostichus eleginoides]|nr:hypothetical protein NQZ68_002959 [Dissostichus eleginoides]